MAIRSDTGQVLFSKMIELGYSDKEVCFDRAKAVPTVIVLKEKIADIWLISVRIKRDECKEDGTWKVDLWWPLDPHDVDCDMGEMVIYSKYNIYGKLI